MVNLILILALLFSIPEDSLKTIEIDSTNNLIIKSMPKKKPELQITIETAIVYPGQDSVTFNIYSNSKSASVAGFEMTIECRSRLVDILRIDQGELQDSCAWEQFSSRRLERNEYQRWHIVSLASMGSIDPPKCFTPDSKMSIAKITVRIRKPEIYTDTLHPFYFVWPKCSDNSFSDSTGSQLLVGLIESWGVPVDWLTPEQTEFNGPAGDCFVRAKRPPMKVISFINGGLVFSSSLQPVINSDTIMVDTIPPSKIE